jgi:hypothetical protein
MDDNTDIAVLAATVERSMRQSLQGSSGLRHNRTDFRNFLNGQHPNVQHQPHMPPPNYYNGNYSHPNYGPPMPQQNVPGYNMPPDEYGVPSGPLNEPIKQYVIPEHMNVPNNGVQAPNYQPVYQPNPTMENTGNFVVPNYNQPTKQYLEDEQEFRVALVKEIKSQKKSLNKLIKTQENTILMVEKLSAKILELADLLKIQLTPEPTPIENDDKDKS